MKNPLIPSRQLAFLSLGLALAAGTAARAQNDTVQPAAPVVAEQADLASYTYAQRSEFTTAVNRAVTQLDALITPLTKRQKAGIAGGSDAMTLEKLYTSRTELNHEIAQLDNATPESWASQREAVLAALATTQEAYEKAAKEYNQT